MRRLWRPSPLSAPLLGLLWACALEAPVGAQPASLLTVRFPGGTESMIPVETEGGYPVIPVSSLARLGWTAEGAEGDGAVVLRHRTGLELDFRPGSPFVGWEGEVVQMVDAPYWSGSTFFVPLQLAVDLFPGFLPDAYEFDEERSLLLAEGAEPSAVGPDAAADPGAPDGPAAPPADDQTDPPAVEDEEVEEAAAAMPLAPWAPASGGSASKVIVIDPGHGGEDTGLVGPGGLEEKEVALSVGLALARALARSPGAEVWLTRDRDIALPVEIRGRWANQWRSDRPAAFVSIHANALPGREGVRGFETYFLAEARTEQERRVVEAESDSLAGPMPYDPRVLEYREASAVLAGEVQWELGEFHPGPDRGVRQGPLPAIMGIRMPAVLVEVGFLTNPEEERLLARDDFHREAAEAIARAIGRFLELDPAGGAG